MNTEEKLNNFYLIQIKEILEEYNGKKGQKSSIPEGGNNDILIHNLITRIFATIERIVGRNSEYYKHALKNASGEWRASKVLDFLIGTIEGLYHDIKNGNWGHTITKKVSRKYEVVKTDTLTNFMKDNNILHCDFMKLNGEGSEFKIILSTSKEIL